MKRLSYSEIDCLRAFAGLWRASVCVLGLLLLGAAWQSSVAGEHTPSDLYDVRQLVLENGLRVILKSRSGARTVSMRLAVDVGHWDFPCGRQETAHFLEHLLFTGTTDHEESELDALIESHGGSWNATTSREETVYEIDIVSDYADLALDTLFEIMSTSEISAKDVYTSRQIVHREMGGRPSAARRWLYSLGLGKGAWSSAWEILGAGTSAGCPALETADAITRRDILDAYATYYVPGNMVLVVVGDFDSSVMLDRIQSTFGQLAPGVAPPRTALKLLSSDARIAVESHFSPLLDSDAFVFLAFPLPNKDSADRYVFRVLEACLHKRLFKILRVNSGLAYSPGAFSTLKRDFGLMATYADVYVGNMDTALEAMQVQIGWILDGYLEASEVDEIKQGLLLAEARKYERNSEFAEYYVEARHAILPDGSFTDETGALAAVTAEDVTRVTREFLRKDRGVVLRVAPTLTYGELVCWIGVALLTLFVWLLDRWRRRVRRKRVDDLSHVQFANSGR